MFFLLEGNADLQFNPASRTIPFNVGSCERTFTSHSAPKPLFLQRRCQSTKDQATGRLLQLRVLRLGFLPDGDVGNPYCGSPTFRTNSVNRGSECRGSSKKSFFKPSRNQSRS